VRTQRQKNAATDFSHLSHFSRDFSLQMDLGQVYTTSLNARQPRFTSKPTITTTKIRKQRAKSSKRNQRKLSDRTLTVIRYCGLRNSDVFQNVLLAQTTQFARFRGVFRLFSPFFDCSRLVLDSTELQFHRVWSNDRSELGFSPLPRPFRSVSLTKFFKFSRRPKFLSSLRLFVNSEDHRLNCTRF